MRPLAVAVAALLFAVAAQAGLTLISANRSRSGSGNGASSNASVSADGRRVAFESLAKDLVDNDGNIWSDVFVYDADTSRTVLVSVALSGSAGNGDSKDAILSANGRYVLFTSEARDLVSTPVGHTSVFLRDMQTNTTVLVSVNLAGDAGGNRESAGLALSADGTKVLFSSMATDLVSLADGNDDDDIFVRDMTRGTTQLVSMNRYGDGTPNQWSFDGAISADGRFAAFCSIANNVIPDDGNTNTDIFLRDLTTGRTTLVSANTSGKPANRGAFRPSFTADGRKVAFDSIASDLASGDGNGNDSDAFVRDLGTGRTILASVDEGGVSRPGDTFGPVRISADGRYVAFQTAAPLLAADTNKTTDAWLRDLNAGRTILLNTSSDGQPGDGASTAPSISADGRFAAFLSYAHNFGWQDANTGPEVALKDIVTGELRLISVTPAGTTGNRGAARPILSANGRTVVFESDASDLAPGDTNSKTDLFAWSPPPPPRRRAVGHH